MGRVQLTTKEMSLTGTTVTSVGKAGKNVNKIQKIVQYNDVYISIVPLYNNMQAAWFHCARKHSLLTIYITRVRVCICVHSQDLI